MTPVNTAVTIASLAHPSTDPTTLITRVRGALGWVGSDFVVGLQSYDELMATLQVATDLEGLVRIGDPTSPPLRLLRALNAAHPDLRLTRVTNIDSPWRWTRLGGGAGDAAGVALRQQTYSDVVSALGRAGVAFRVLPNDTSTEEMLRIGREVGSAVVDLDELEPDGILIVGFLETLDPLSYGLLSREHHDPGEDAVVWLSITAEREAAGTLMTALEQFSVLGLDLDFLHSDPLAPGRHDFFLGFRADPSSIGDLQLALATVGFSSRVLASFARERRS